MRFPCLLAPCLVIASAPLGGCFLSKTCTAIFIPALAVTVVDAQTGAPICDAAVDASQGPHHEELTVFSPPAAVDGGQSQCSYSGGTRGGAWTLTVTRSGFKTQTVVAPPPPEGDCGVNQPSDVTVTLVREPPK